MVFGFFTRKTGSVVDAGSSTMAPIATDNNSASQFPPKQLHTPAPSIDSSSSQLKEKKDPSPTGSDLLPPSGPVDTPSPGLGVDESDKGNEADEATDASALHALIASVPPQTLHAYTLAHLSPVPLSPFPFANPAAGLILQEPPVTPTPRTLSVLREFFSNLSPPPKLHCVRCHKGYFELENTDRSCLVPHDDDSAIVDRVKTGLGTEYETLWGCCGRTVEGDGDQGPPDGWCYEGRHTADLKRARFRADSTPHDEKLVSCAQLRCGEPPLLRRGSTRRSRKRVRVDSHVGDVEDTPSVASSSHSGGASKGHRKSGSLASSTKEKDGDNARPTKRRRSRKPSSVSIIAHENVNGDAMEVDGEDASLPVSTIHPSPPESPRRPPPSSASTSNAKPKRKAISPRKPRSKGSLPGNTVPLQRSPLSSSFTAPSTSSQNGLSRPTTPTKKGPKLVVEMLTKSPSMVSLSDGGSNKLVAKKGSLSSLKDKSDSMVLRSASATGSRKVVSHVRGESMKKTKTVGEVVETSVDGEAEWA